MECILNMVLLVVIGAGVILLCCLFYAYVYSILLSINLDLEWEGNNLKRNDKSMQLGLQ